VKHVKLAVASDLHAYDSTSWDMATRPSYIDIAAPHGADGGQLIPSLLDLVANTPLRADFLLCPGDLGHRAHPPSMAHAWKTLQDLARALGAELLVTAGNHDVDSRHNYNYFDAKGFLQALTPPFPLFPDSSFDRFWSRHFVLLRRDDVRFVILNSSAYHGAERADADPEYVHGRVAPSTLRALESELSQDSDPPPLNVVLCHHHPIPHDEHGLGADDIMKGGSELVRLLASGTFGEWLIVHGHKHFPRLTYAQGQTAVVPTVFAAGSLSVALHPEISGIVRNQFYIIDLDVEHVSRHGLQGRFRCWDWSNGVGWLQARADSGLPGQGGFGAHERPRQLATQIAEHFAKRKSIPWPEVVSRFQPVQYLLPRDFATLITELRERQGLRIFFEDGPVPSLMERPK
jgi:3',5'-cyclic AMP phosphodiesterase CpdA